MMTMKETMKHLALGAILVIASAPGARAEIPFAATVEQPERTLDTAGFTTFEIHVANLTASPIAIRATRLLVDVPDSTWHTSICTISTCYPEEISVTPPEPVDAGGETGFTLHVTAGRSYEQTARITLRLDTGPGTESIDLPFTIVVRQPPASIFRVEPERLSAAGSPDEPIFFDSYVHNETSDTLTLGVVRVEDYFPDGTWESAICIEDTCYPVDVSNPPPIVVDPYHAALFRLKIVGRTPGQGHVVLRFNSARGTDPFEKRFTVTIAPSGVSIVERERLPVGAPFPDPAAGDLSIPLPAERSEIDRARLIVSAIDGSGRIDLSKELRAALRRGDVTLLLETGGLASGSYLYTLDVGGRSATFSFRVVR